MQKSLLNNDTLKRQIALNPSMHCHTITKGLLEKLGSLCAHLVEETKLGEEIRGYVNDHDLPPFGDSDRVDKWWAGEKVNSKYPTLSKMCGALVTVFHGAHVESTFSIMSRIITKETSRMQICLLNAIQIVKYELNCSAMTGLEYFKRTRPATDPVCHQLCLNI